jgi:hypothetical protein
MKINFIIRRFKIISFVFKEISEQFFIICYIVRMIYIFLKLFVKFRGCIITYYIKKSLI